MTTVLAANYDRQYNARGMISDHPQIVERGAKRSTEARAHLPCRLGIA